MSSKPQIKLNKEIEELRLVILLAQKRQGIREMEKLDARLRIGRGSIEAMFKGEMAPTAEVKETLFRLAGHDDVEETRGLLKRAMKTHGIKDFVRMDDLLGCRVGTTRRFKQGLEYLSLEARIKLKVLAGEAGGANKMRSKLGSEAYRVIEEWQAQGLRVEMPRSSGDGSAQSKVRLREKLEAKDVKRLLDELKDEGVILLRVRNRARSEPEPGSVMGEMESQSWRLEAAPLAPHAKNQLRSAVEGASLPWR